MSLEPHRYRKALRIALERLWTLKLPSSLPYTSLHCKLSEQTDRQQDTLIYALCLVILYFHLLSTYNLWHGDFRSNTRRYRAHLHRPLYSFSFHSVRHGSLSYRRSSLIIILHQLDDIRLPTLNLPAINLFQRPMYFSFSRTFFFTPLPFSFCYSNGGLARKYLYFCDFRCLFFFSAGGSGLCLCGSWRVGGGEGVMV